MELTLLTTAHTTLCSVLVARTALNQWFCLLLSRPGTKVLSEPQPGKAAGWGKARGEERTQLT